MRNIRIKKGRFIVLTALSLLTIFLVNFLTSCQPEREHTYVWLDPSDYLYVTVQSKQDIKPELLFPQNSELQFVPVSKAPPIPVKKSLKTISYRPIKTTQQSLKYRDKNLIFLVGETHFGTSQKEVAEVLANLFTKYEIDAILVEQPDNLTFNWTPYESLKENPEKAIANLQEAMLTQADQTQKALNQEEALQKRLDKYRPYFKKYSSDEAIQKIFDDFGQKGLEDLQQISEQLDQNQSVLNKYENSEYISAADYFYMMLNLRGLNIPFYTIESKELRDKFEEESKKTGQIPAKVMEERDLYMVKKTETISKEKGYRQMILICGAFHLDGLKAKLNEKGYQATVVYNSKPRKFKKKEIMAVLVNPDDVLQEANKQPNPQFKSLPEYNLEPKPSKQLITKFQTYLDDNPEFKTFEKELLQKFKEEYKKQEFRYKLSWSLQLPVNEYKTLVVSMNAQEQSLTFTTEGQLKSQQISEVPDSSLPTSKPNMKLRERIKEINKNRQYSWVITVEDKLDYYEIYTGQDDPIYIEDIKNFFETVKGQFPLDLESNAKLYLDLKDFSPSHIKALDNSFKIYQKQHDPDLEMITYPREGDSTESQDLVLYPGIEFEIKSKSPTTTESINGQQYLGQRIDFIGKIKDKFFTISLQVYSKSKEALESFFKHFTTVLRLYATSHQPVSVSEIVNQTLHLMKEEYGSNYQEVIVKFTDETGETQIVIHPHEMTRSSS